MENQDTGKILKVLIASAPISTPALTKMKKFLDPTLVISVGHSTKSNERYSTGCFSTISFGHFYERDGENLAKLLEKTFNALTLKSKDFIADAASGAFNSIKVNTVDPKASSYEPSDLEDDVYVLFKDFFMNVQKWGHENIGEQLPEGVFTISFDRNEGRRNVSKKLVFSYDCKLNANLEGFDFSIAERDKAIRYIKSLSSSMELTEFADSHHVDGHIFISNKFKDANVRNTYRAIKESVQEDFDTEIIFITTDALTSFHKKYRENHTLIDSARDLVMFLLSEKFGSLSGDVLTKEHVDYIVNKTLRYAKKGTVDFNEVTRELTRENFKTSNG